MKSILMIKRRIFLLLIILFCSGIGCHISNAPIVKGDGGRRERKNVILISLDTLRADHLGCYGYERTTSPVLDTFAKRGVLFENCISSAPWTLPAHVSLLTSLYSTSHSVIDDGLFSVPSMLPTSLPPEIKTLPEILQKGGYETRAITSHIYVSDKFGFERGFNVFYYDQEQRAKVITQRALSWLDSLSDRPFFLFLHYFDCHSPYAAPGSFRNMFDHDYKGETNSRELMKRYAKGEIPQRDLDHIIALYDGEIRYVDTCLEYLIRGIEKHGFLDNTMIIITSDHGEEFKEHGSFGHGITLFDEVIKVPLLLFLPRASYVPQRITSQVSIIDIMPSILDFLGVEIPSGIEGKSFIPSLEGVVHTPRVTYSETSRYKGFQACLRTDERKYIVSDNFDGQQEALYNLENDPGEKHNLASTVPSTVDEYREKLLSNREIVLGEQLCLRISVHQEPCSVRGEITTSGRFQYIDSMGWWPGKSFTPNAAKNHISIHHPNISDRVGINIVVEPPDATIHFSQWTMNGQPVNITRIQNTPHYDNALNSSTYYDLMSTLTTDPDINHLTGNKVLLFKSSAMMPQKALTEGKSWKRKELSEEEREKLKALGYLQ